MSIKNLVFAVGLGLVSILQADIPFLWLDAPTSRSNPNDPKSLLWVPTSTETPVATGLDPKDSSGDATPPGASITVLPSTTTEPGRMIGHPGDSADWSSFVTSGGTFTFTATETVGTATLTLEIRDSSGVTVLFTNSGTTAMVSSAVLSSGTYTVSVTSTGPATYTFSYSGIAATSTPPSTATPTASPTSTPTPLGTSTETSTATPTHTFNPNTVTVTPTFTETPSITETSTVSETATPTPSPSDTFTVTETSTETPTSTATPTVVGAPVLIHTIFDGTAGALQQLPLWGGNQGYWAGPLGAPNETTPPSDAWEENVFEQSPGVAYLVIHLGWLDGWWSQIGHNWSGWWPAAPCDPSECVDKDSYDNLEFWIRGELGGETGISIGFDCESVPNCAPGVAVDGVYTAGPTLTTTWEKVVIPLSAFSWVSPPHIDLWGLNILGGATQSGDFKFYLSEIRLVKY